MKFKEPKNSRTQELKTSGFTLIELVIVMAIVATLTALAAFNFGQARARARDIQRKSELKAIQNALELYKNDQMPQRYPDTNNFSAALVTAYMPVLPVDPKEKVSNGSWYDYLYTLDATDSLKYTVKACLENTADLDRLFPVTACGQSNAGVIYQITQP